MKAECRPLEWVCAYKIHIFLHTILHTNFAGKNGENSKTIEFPPWKLAERVGFEPTVQSPTRRFSRPLP